MALQECRFKGLIKIGDKEWEWCSLFNARTADLNCAECPYKALPPAPTVRRFEEAIV